MNPNERKIILEDIDGIEQYHVENGFATYVIYPEYIEISFDGKKKRINEAELKLYQENIDVLIVKVHPSDNQL